MTFMVHLDQKWSNVHPENEEQESLYASIYKQKSTKKYKLTKIAEMLAQISLQQRVPLKKWLLYFVS